MKKLVFVVTVALLAMAILAVGCAKTPAPATTSNVTGVLTEINTPDDPGPDVVIVETPQGPQTIPITAATTYSIEGRSCILADVGKVADEGNVTYECTVVVTGMSPYGDDTAAVAIYVTKK